MNQNPLWRKTLTILIVVVVVTGLVYVMDEERFLSFFPIVVREARASDTISQDYFGFDSKDIKPRNVLVVTGPFTIHRRLSASLFLVKGGVVYKGNSFSLGRTSNHIPSRTWQTLDIELALGDEPNTSEVFLGASGHSSGCSCWTADQWPIPRLNVVAAQALPGQLDRGREYIVYVEGDREFEVNREMSLEDFAQKNQGNYIVIAVKWAG